MKLLIMQSPPSSCHFLPLRSKYSPHQSISRLTTGWTIGLAGFEFRRGLKIFHSDTVSRLVLGPTQPPIQWVTEALSLGVKRPGHEADHSPPFSAEVKECVELYLHSPKSFHGAVLC